MIRNPSDLFSLQGRIALVTGSSRGLGLIFAEGLVRSGATVYLNGRDGRRLAAAVEELRERAHAGGSEGTRIRQAPFDVTDEASVGSGVGEILEESGRIDLLVNNAGLQHRAPLETFAVEDWNAVLTTNLTAAYLVARSVVPQMIERRSGKIINITSLQSELGRRSIAPYAASKGGLKMLTRAMAVEWAHYNIQINAIAPGYFITDMTKPLADDPEFDGWLKGRTPAGRWGDPDELVGTLIYLASEASSFVNGQTVYVDGGIIASI